MACCVWLGRLEAKRVPIESSPVPVTLEDGVERGSYGRPWLGLKSTPSEIREHLALLPLQNREATIPPLCPSHHHHLLHPSLHRWLRTLYQRLSAPQRLGIKCRT
jgi:hypothetical protein